MVLGRFPSQKFKSFSCLEALKVLLGTLAGFKISEHSLKLGVHYPVTRPKPAKFQWW